MRIIQLMAGALLVALSQASSALVLVSSDFSSGSEGWRAENGARAFEWQASGGQSGGYVRAKDGGADTLWFFTAPTAFLGDMSAAAGGSLNFALTMQSGGKPVRSGSYADVQLLGTNGIRLAASVDPAPGSGWTSYSVPLVADGSWKVGSITGAAAAPGDLASVMSSLAAVRILGDFVQGLEITGLDSVSLSTPVPEHSTGAFFLAGLLLLYTWIRKRV